MGMSCRTCTTFARPFVGKIKGSCVSAPWQSTDTRALIVSFSRYTACMSIMLSHLLAYTLLLRTHAASEYWLPPRYAQCAPVTACSVCIYVPAPPESVSDRVTFPCQLACQGSMVSTRTLLSLLEFTLLQRLLHQRLLHRHRLTQAQRACPLLRKMLCRHFST